MHDIKWIREAPEAFDAAMQKRGAEVRAADILSVDAAQREKITQLQVLQNERNQKSKQIGAVKAKGEDAAPLMAEVAALKDQMEALEAALAQDAVTAMLERIPNVLAEDVPFGADEFGNVLLRQWGEPTTLAFEAKDHVALGEALGLMDFESAATISGARFVLLSGALARLERALGQFMLDMHTKENAYTEVSPPLLVREQSLYGTGQLPKFAEDCFQTTAGHWMIPTAEVSLTNIVADKIVTESYLPRRYVAYTPCFRSEAGSAGRDTRGMIRQHQFYKVEMVSITHPEASEAEHERMTDCAEKVLQALGLPYRVMLLCSGDTGFGAKKTYDLEVWLPSQNTYREISSCSNCGDFQARRMKARFRPEGEEKGTRFVHTLNGSGVAVGRALVAVLENYQQADGSITIPEVLRPYMGGESKIG